MAIKLIDPIFKEGEIVYSPFDDKLIVINNNYDTQKVEPKNKKPIYVPVCLLGFVKKDGTLNKRRNFRVFAQHRLRKNLSDPVDHSMYR